jgi:hypothetical protein
MRSALIRSAASMRGWGTIRPPCRISPRRWALIRPIATIATIRPSRSISWAAWQRPRLRWKP